MRHAIAVVMLVACSKGQGGDSSAICDAMSVASANASALRKAALGQYESAVHAHVLYYQWEHLDYDGKRQITTEQDAGMKYSGGWLRARGYAHTAMGLCRASYDLHDQLRAFARNTGLEPITDDANQLDCPRIANLDDTGFDKKVAAWTARGDAAAAIENAHTASCYKKLGGAPQVIRPLELSIQGE